MTLLDARSEQKGGGGGYFISLGGIERGLAFCKARDPGMFPLRKMAQLPAWGFLHTLPLCHRLLFVLMISLARFCPALREKIY